MFQDVARERCQVIFRAPRHGGRPLPASQTGGRDDARAVRRKDGRGDQDDRDGRGVVSQGVRQEMEKDPETTSDRTDLRDREGVRRVAAAAPLSSAGRRHAAAHRSDPWFHLPAVPATVPPRARNHPRGAVARQKEPRRLGAAHPQYLGLDHVQGHPKGAEDLGSNPSLGPDPRRLDDAAPARSRRLQEELNSWGELRQPFGDRRREPGLRMPTG